jgi:quinoprotein glucose dehydrogenase
MDLPAPRRPWASGLLLALTGAILAIGGGRLAVLGGSLYYLIAGLALLVSGGLLLARRREGLWLFAAVVLGTLVWAIAEVGLDWWPLAARGDLIFLVALWLLTPWVARSLGPANAQAHWAVTAGPLAGVMICATVVGLVSLAAGPSHATSGRLPAASTTMPRDYAGVPDDDWRAWGRDWTGDRWSPLTQLTPANVGQLKVAWTFRTGDIPGPNDPSESTFELTPLKVGDRLFLCTPHDIAIALDAETGQPIWRYDPKLVEYARTLQHLTCRGLSYHEDPAAADAPCAQRLFLPTADARLIALDARTGTPCPGFGRNGAVNLWAGMPQVQPGFYYSTAPPVVTKDLVIVAGENTDNFSTAEPSGVIRAYDVRTGALVWNWDSKNPDETAPLKPGQSYSRNSPNSWNVGAADEALGLVYWPMGNETPDQFGGYRTNPSERFNSAIVALDIATGKLRWVYQTVHHDLWDMDIGGQPSLVDLPSADGVVPALVASTKRGDLYVLDRRTGAPITPAPERPVPQGAAPGDRTSPTQPFSALTFLPPPLTEARMWGATVFDQLWCRIRFRSMRYEGIFTPPSVQGTLVYPGNFGVFDWGGIAVDPARRVAFANPDYFAFVSKLTPRPVNRRPVIGGSSREDAGNPMFGTPYSVDLHPFRSPLGLPCQAPPWGAVAGVDLAGARIAWSHPNGTVRDVAPVPLPLRMGVPSLGGPIVTAGGLAFLSGTLDQYLRAYDLTTGRELWRGRLPAGAQATPMTYRARASGRQFVVVAAGGHGTLGTKRGDYVIAYALPR